MNSQYKWFICLAALFCSCSKPGILEEVLKRGEIVYPARADSVIISAGKERMQLSWATSDSRISHFRIFWNNGDDSLQVKAVHNSQQLADTMRVMLENLPEAKYMLNVYSYDNEGNRSIRSEAEGSAYGAQYRNTLLNRGIKKVEVVAGTGFAAIDWMPADSLETITTLHYTDKDGTAQTLHVQPAETQSKLVNYKNGTPFSFSTAYLPEKNAIDTFYARTETVPAPPVVYPQLDKTKFKALNLPGDAGTAWSWLLPYLWDNSIAEGKGYHTPNLQFPLHFNVDMGVTARLHEFRWWQRQGATNLYNGGNPKRFEIWGSNSPAADGSYTGWTKLLDCTSIKPSGSPLGKVTQQDIDYAAAGELFKFPEGIPAVRYIRIKVLEVWSPSPYAHMMEVTLWGEAF